MPDIAIHHLGRVDYLPTYAAMQEFTDERCLQPSSNKPDQLWICEHPPVFTQGLAGKAEHIFLPGGIPVATFAIGEAGAVNAALFAVAILALNDHDLARKLAKFRVDQAEKVLSKTLPDLP